MKKSIMIVVAMFVFSSTSVHAGILQTVKEKASSYYNSSVSAITDGVSYCYDKSTTAVKQAYSSVAEYVKGESNPQEYNEDEIQSEKLKTYYI